MKKNMIKHTKKINMENVRKTQRITTKYEPKIKMDLPTWIGDVKNECIKTR